MPIYILGIESSCDDTSASVIKDRVMLSNIIANQQVHEEYGGVVPELASRAHQQNIIPVIDKALKVAGIDKKQLNAVAFTLGPGLLGSLLVGTSFAKAFAMGLNIPIIVVNHLQAHVLAHFIESPDKENPPFPFLCLTVSGGHTQIVEVNAYDDMKILGQTIDDAAGEAFDKAAKMMDLPYPGGPIIDKYAKMGNPDAFEFAKPRIDDLNYSFSGLKTSLLYFLRDKLKEDENFIAENVYDICASYQKAIISTLMQKLYLAIEQTGIKHVAIAGGVSANSELRNEINKLQTIMQCKVYIPDFQFTTDNAAMVAIAGHFKYINNDFSDLSVKPYSRNLTM
ncbi:MAG: tRNA (adenosine(37)-N6)-threonylcarbamoyltransferase complex transferase subunit TsaD [Lentimicrobiaceae bacterium]|nr:tRNA (adenosine(37)-N6)-threonylcarbamoyltransferase complex transferase subunit TsaD [Lentimicrobiaceae bacterium]